MPIRDALLFADAKGQYQQAQTPSQEFLFGGSDTVRCLVDILREMRRAVREPVLAEDVRVHLVRVTGAARSMLATQGRTAIEWFRRYDDADAASVLAFAARSDDSNLRINATLILADVIDNTTVCVPIDHLYDPKLLSTPGGESGRINLVGVVSVVAPWAYKENFDNIDRLLAKLTRDLEGQGNVAQARAVVDNLKERLAFQDRQKAPNKFVPLPASMSACASYTPLWANAEAPNLTYGN